MAADPLEAALQQIEKQFGKGSVMRLGDEVRVPVEVIPTGSIALDKALGIGGLPRGRIIEIYGPESSGKALALDTPIPTPKGWTVMGDLSAGDEVFAADGSVTRISFAAPVMYGHDCYAVRFADGAEIVADAEHLWVTETLYEREYRRWLYPLMPKTTREIADTLWARDGHVLNHSVPVCGALEYPEQILTVAPYTMGAWLGDGTSASADITSVDEEIPAHIQADGYLVTRRNARARAPLYHISLPRAKDRECLICLSYPPVARGLCPACYGRQRNAGRLDSWPLIGQPPSLQGKLRETGVLGNKHIPEQYLRASVRQRLALLQGLMDTDGTVAEGGACEFSVVNENLARGAFELMIGLGIKTTLRESPAVLDGRVVGTRYRLCFLTDLPVFRLGRKACRLDPLRGRRSKLRSVVAVEPVASVPVRCIQVEDPEHLYLVGRHCVPTHNTTLALHAVASAQKAGDVAAFIDAEHALDPDYAKALGVDTDALLVSQPDTGEQALEIADMLIRSGGIGIVVIDSVAALVPKAEIDGEMGDSHVGLQARLMSQALRKITGKLSETRTTAIFINQLREKIGVMFGSPETTTGGKALKFYASIRLDIRRIETLKVGTESVGSRTRVKVVKNKCAPPFGQAEMDIIYGQGISREGGLIDLGVEQGIVLKSGAWYTYDGGQLGQGKENARGFLRGNPDLADEIEKRIKDKLGIGPRLDSEDPPGT